MAFGDYVRVLRTFWRSILAVALLGMVVGGVLTLAVTPTYTATAQVLFTANSGHGGQDLAYGSTYTQSRMINYQGLATSDKVLSPVVSPPSQDNGVGLGLTQTPKQLAAQVSADFVPTATILNLHVTDHSAATATKIVAAVAQSLIIQVSIAELQTSAGATAAKSAVTGSLITEPTRPDSPTSPKLQLYLVGGLLLGLLLGLAIALLRYLRWGTEKRGSKNSTGTSPAAAPQKPAKVETAKPTVTTPAVPSLPLSPPPPPAQEAGVVAGSAKPASKWRSRRSKAR